MNESNTPGTDALLIKLTEKGGRTDFACYDELTDFARRLEIRNRRLMEALHSIVEEATRVTPSEDVALGNMATGADPLLQLERAIGIGDRQAHIEDIERYQVEIAALKTRAEKAETEVHQMHIKANESCAALIKAQVALVQLQQDVRPLIKRLVYSGDTGLVEGFLAKHPELKS